jgi:RNA polymerase-interacting CarD/CdnL/TRCF family regulator
MALTAGCTAVYPGHGPCRIGHNVKKVFDGRAMMFYHLTVLDDRGGELFVPVEKARGIGIRLLMKKSEIPKLLDHLKKRAKPADNWRQRANDNLKLVNSGSPFDLAEVVASLTELRDNRPLTLGESGTLGRAKDYSSARSQKSSENQKQQSRNSGRGPQREVGQSPYRRVHPLNSEGKWVSVAPRGVRSLILGSGRAGVNNQRCCREPGHAGLNRTADESGRSGTSGQIERHSVVRFQPAEAVAGGRNDP